MKEIGKEEQEEVNKERSGNEKCWKKKRIEAPQLYVEIFFPSIYS